MKAIRILVLTCVVCVTRPFCSAQNTDLLTSSRILTTGEQQSALDFILNKTLASAFATYGLDSLEGLLPVIAMRAFTITNSTHSDFQFALNGMLQQLFHDGHTRVEVDAANYKRIDLCLSWLPDQAEKSSWSLIVSCDTEYAKTGDAVVSLGGASPPDLFERLQDVIPHENDYFLTGLPESWLIREDFLYYFHLFDDEPNVELVLERDGHVLEPVMVPIVEPNQNGPSNRTFVSYDMDDSVVHVGRNSTFVSYEIKNDSGIGVFTLNECIYNDTFMTLLNEFWAAVMENPNIDKVVLDLRKNRGGDFTVAPAFLRFITSEPYRLFGVLQRFSDDFCLQVPTLCDPNTLVTLERLGANVSHDYASIPDTVMSAFFSPAMAQPETPFAGDFYVLTSGVTFSSAHLFAGVVQNNDLGTLVGTPTGNTPTFWGNVIEFKIPHTDLKLFLTTSQTMFPGEGESIVPDVVVPTTREDVMQGKDAQLEFVIAAETRAISTFATESPTNRDTSDDGNNGDEKTLLFSGSSHQGRKDGAFLALAWCCTLVALILL